MVLPDVSDVSLHERCAAYRLGDQRDVGLAEAGFDLGAESVANAVSLVVVVEVGVGILPEFVPE